jgi:hypothetical protein
VTTPLTVYGVDVGGVVDGGGLAGAGLAGDGLADDGVDGEPLQAIALAMMTARTGMPRMENY